MKCIVFLSCLALACAASSKTYKTENKVGTHEGSYYNPWQFYSSYYQNYQGLPWYSYPNYVQNPMYQSWVHSQYPWYQTPQFQSLDWMNQGYVQDKYQYGVQSWPQYYRTQFPEFQKYWTNQYNYLQEQYQHGEYPYVQYPWTQHKQFEGQQLPINWFHTQQEYIQGKPAYEGTQGEYQQYHENPFYWRSLLSSHPWTQQNFAGYKQQFPSWYQQWSKYWNPQQFEGKQYY